MRWIFGETRMARYGKKAGKGQARDARAQARHAPSGRSARKVKSRKQAIAIGLSEARRPGQGTRETRQPQEEEVAGG